MKNKHAVILGTLGGKSRSEKKINASRQNGKKGGRPPCPSCHNIKGRVSFKSYCNFHTLEIQQKQADYISENTP